MSEAPVAVVYGMQGEAIVDRIEHDTYVFVAWRGSSDQRGWATGRGSMPIKSCTPHPDADRLVAEFVTWGLSQ